jgi:hypothetical protein
MTERALSGQYSRGPAVYWKSVEAFQTSDAPKLGAAGMQGDPGERTEKPGAAQLVQRWIGAVR